MQQSIYELQWILQKLDRWLYLCGVLNRIVDGPDRILVLAAAGGGSRGRGPGEAAAAAAGLFCDTRQVAAGWMKLKQEALPNPCECEHGSSTGVSPDQSGMHVTGLHDDAHPAGWRSREF